MFRYIPIHQASNHPIIQAFKTSTPVSIQHQASQSCRFDRLNLKMPEVTRQTSTKDGSDEPSDHPNGFVTIREIDGQRVNMRIYNDGRISGTLPDGSRPVSRSGTSTTRRGHSAAFSGGRMGALRRMSMGTGSRMNSSRHHPYGGRPTPRSVPDNLDAKNMPLIDWSQTSTANPSTSSQVEGHNSGAGGADGPTSAPTMTIPHEQESDEARGRRLQSQPEPRSPSSSPGRRELSRRVPNEVDKIHYKERKFNEQQEQGRRH
jgi:hypothetical protein